MPPPDCFARYIAESAHSASAAASPAGRGNVAMPIESCSRSRAATSSGGKTASAAFDDSRGDSCRSLSVRVRQDNRELVATVASWHVVHAHGLLDRGGDRLQDLVADGVAVPVVVELEAVHIEHQEREEMLRTARAVRL